MIKVQEDKKAFVKQFQDRKVQKCGAKSLKKDDPLRCHRSRGHRGWHEGFWKGTPGPIFVW